MLTSRFRTNVDHGLNAHSAYPGDGADPTCQPQARLHLTFYLHLQVPIPDSCFKIGLKRWIQRIVTRRSLTGQSR
jgi:hypothetical protein